MIGNSHILPNWYYSILLVLMWTVAILVIFVMYVWIVCIARQYILRNPRRFAILHKQSAADIGALSEDQRSDEQQEQIVNNANKLQQFRLVQVLGAIIVANAITWIPMIALAVTGAIIGSSRVPALYVSFAYSCYLSQILLHPLLEIVLINELKKSILKI